MIWLCNDFFERCIKILGIFGRADFLCRFDKALMAISVCQLRLLRLF